MRWRRRSVRRAGPPLVGALANGTLLPAQQHREMWTTVTTEGASWLPYAHYGLGLFEFGPDVTGGRRLRGVGGSFWGAMFFTVSTDDGEHVISVQSNFELASWEVLQRIFEAGFGITFTP